jgi:hypothetical protein
VYSTYYKVDLTKTHVFEYVCDDRLRACEEAVYNVADLDTETFLKGLSMAGSGDFIYADPSGEMSRFVAMSTLPVGSRIVKSSSGGGGGSGGSGGAGGAGGGGGLGSGNGTGADTDVTGGVVGKGGSGKSPVNDPDTPSNPALCTPRGAPPVLTPPPPACYKSSPGIERMYTFAWANTLEDTIDGIYDNDDFQFYKAKPDSLSGPYCVKDGFINGLPTPYLCRIFFTRGP